MSRSTSLKALAAQARTRWQGLEARERRLVGLMLVVVGLALLWWVGLAPALRTLREAPPRIAALQGQLQQMQRWAAESATLKSATPVTPDQSRRALEAAVGRLGAGARLSVLGDRATVTLQGVRGDALWAWLAEVRATARARPVEAQLTHGGSGYSGSVVLQLPGEGS
jgi:general secretion pathway protein M